MEGLGDMGSRHVPWDNGGPERLSQGAARGWIDMPRAAMPCEHLACGAAPDASATVARHYIELRHFELQCGSDLTN